VPFALGFMLGDLSEGRKAAEPNALDPSSGHGVRAGEAAVGLPMLDVIALAVQCGHVGYQIQINQWVLGVEGSVDGTSLRKNVTASFPNFLGGTTYGVFSRGQGRRLTCC
jgi:hypothetical protein